MHKVNDTGSTALALEKTAEPSMAAPSKPSPVAGRAAKTEPTAQDCLSITQSDLARLRQYVPITIGNHPTKNIVILAVEGVLQCPTCHSLRFFEEMVDRSMCQYCRDTGSPRN